MGRSAPRAVRSVAPIVQVPPPYETQRNRSMRRVPYLQSLSGNLTFPGVPVTPDPKGPTHWRGLGLHASESIWILPALSFQRESTEVTGILSRLALPGVRRASFLHKSAFGQEDLHGVVLPFASRQLAAFTERSTMKTKKASMLIMGVVLCLALAGCGGGGSTDPGPLPTDYSIPGHWLSLPATIDKAVDVFYLYPTAWSNSNPNPQICAIDEPSMLTQAPAAFARQATAFETVGNIFAPYYRQDNSSSVDRWSVIAGIPTLDATAAFDYYITHLNNGRPFILLGHSQGSTVLTNILAGYLRDHPEILRRMVAAYIIGSPITRAYLDANPHLRFAEGPDDTGVIISYNTEAPDLNPADNPVLYGMVGLVINPITWTRDETPATTAQGLGSIMPNQALQFVPVPQYADARIDLAHGVLLCESANENVLFSLTGGLRGVYHTFDIPFYYFNLRANAANRVSRFLGTR